MGRINGCPGSETVGFGSQHRRSLCRERWGDVRRGPQTGGPACCPASAASRRRAADPYFGSGCRSHVTLPYVRARGIGEVLVKKAFDGATILRPSVIFGPDDPFFNTLAGIARQTPVLPLF